MKSVPRRGRSGPFFSLFRRVIFDHRQIGVSQYRQGDVPVPTVPAPHLVLVQPHPRLRGGRLSPLASSKHSSMAHTGSPRPLPTPPVSSPRGRSTHSRVIAMMPRWFWCRFPRADFHSLRSGPVGGAPVIPRTPAYWLRTDSAATIIRAGKLFTPPAPFQWPSPCSERACQSAIVQRPGRLIGQTPESCPPPSGLGPAGGRPRRRVGPLRERRRNGDHGLADRPQRLRGPERPGAAEAERSGFGNGHLQRASCSASPSTTSPWSTA